MWATVQERSKGLLIQLVNCPCGVYTQFETYAYSNSLPPLFVAYMPTSLPTVVLVSQFSGVFYTSNAIEPTGRIYEEELTGKPETDKRRWRVPDCHHLRHCIDRSRRERIVREVESFDLHI